MWDENNVVASVSEVVVAEKGVCERRGSGKKGSR
jgi:hypothetical protein